MPLPALRRLHYTERVRTARQTQRDYTFTHPRYPQEHTPQAPSLDHQGDHYERYDYPGRYKRDAAGKPFTQNRLRGHRRDAQVAQVEGDDARLVPGLSFDLEGHPRAEWNRGWRVVRLRHHGVQHTSLEEDNVGGDQGTHYSYTAELVPDDAGWRAGPLPRPRLDGPQIATVVEIECLDRPGLLYDVTQAIFEAGLSISGSMIATYGERAVDVFYVRDGFGHKITHPARLEAVEKRLKAALEPPGPATA